MNFDFQGFQGVLGRDRVDQGLVLFEVFVYSYGLCSFLLEDRIVLIFIFRWDNFLV